MYVKKPATQENAIGNLIEPCPQNKSAEPDGNVVGVDCDGDFNTPLKSHPRTRDDMGSELNEEVSIPRKILTRMVRNDGMGSAGNNGSMSFLEVVSGTRNKERIRQRYHERDRGL